MHNVSYHFFEQQSIMQRQRDPSTIMDDFLGRLLYLRLKPSGEPLCSDTVAHYCLSFLIVGGETLASLLAWSIAFLSSDPSMQAEYVIIICTFSILICATLNALYIHLIMIVFSVTVSSCKVLGPSLIRQYLIALPSAQTIWSG